MRAVHAIKKLRYLRTVMKRMGQYNNENAPATPTHVPRLSRHMYHTLVTKCRACRDAFCVRLDECTFQYGYQTWADLVSPVLEHDPVVDVPGVKLGGGGVSCEERQNMFSLAGSCLSLFQDKREELAVNLSLGV